MYGLVNCCWRCAECRMPKLTDYYQQWARSHCVFHISFQVNIATLFPIEQCSRRCVPYTICASCGEWKMYSEYNNSQTVNKNKIISQFYYYYYWRGGGGGRLERTLGSHFNNNNKICKMMQVSFLSFCGFIRHLLGHMHSSLLSNKPIWQYLGTIPKIVPSFTVHTVNHGVTLGLQIESEFSNRKRTIAKNRVFPSEFNEINGGNFKTDVRKITFAEFSIPLNLLKLVANRENKWMEMKRSNNNNISKNTVTDS